jgi:hypothetical protein
MSVWGRVRRELPSEWINASGRKTIEIIAQLLDLYLGILGGIRLHKLAKLFGANRTLLCSREISPTE